MSADPLLAALIGKLPPSGASWSVEQRTAWLKMMWMAFDVVYGEGGATEIPQFLGARADAAVPRREATRAPIADGPYAAANLGSSRRASDQRFLIDLDGIAFGPSGQIDLADLPAGEMVWDFRPGEQDLGNVVRLNTSKALPPLTIMKG